MNAEVWVRSGGVGRDREENNKIKIRSWQAFFLH